MLLSSRGIVLNSINYGDSSIISKVFSQEKGLITLISNKKRGKRKTQSTYFQPLNAISFVCYWTPQKDIHRTKEVSLNTTVNLPIDSISINAIRFFLAEFLNKIIKEEEQNYLLYDFLEKQVHLLNANEGNISCFHLSFLIALLQYFGIQPSVSYKDNFFDLKEGQSLSTRPLHDLYFEKDSLHLLCKALQNDFNYNRPERQNLLQLIISYYNVQLDCNLENLKSKPVLEAVFG